MEESKDFNVHVAQKVTKKFQSKAPLIPFTLVHFVYIMPIHYKCNFKTFYRESEAQFVL